MTPEALLEVVRDDVAARGSTCAGRIALDNARDLNEAVGRAAGDQALQRFESLITKNLPSAAICRWARTEFLICLPGVDLVQSRRQLEDLVKLLGQCVIRAGGTSLPPLVASAGLARFEGDEALEVIPASERLLRYAREHGGGRVATPEDVALGQRRILVAEDDELTATLLRHVLHRSGYEVTHHPDGRHALDWAAEHDAALILSDVKMPGMDGFELVRELRSLPRHRVTPIVLVSSMSRDSDIIRGLESGANDYVRKPFSPDELSARLRSILGPIDRRIEDP